MLLSRVLFPAHGFDDVLAIEDADEPIDLRHVGQQLGLVPLHEAAGDDDALALARLSSCAIASRIALSDSSLEASRNPQVLMTIASAWRRRR